MFVVIGCT